MHQKKFRLVLCLACFLATSTLRAADFAVATDGGGHVDAAIAGGAELPDDWTFSAWVYFTEGGSYGTGDSPVTVATSQDFFADGLSAEVLIDADENGEQRLELGRSNGYIGEHSTLTIPTNVWTHIAITVSSTKVVRYYINGQDAGVFTTEFAGRDVSLGNTGSGLIRFMENNGYNRKFKGGLDDVQIWNTERSAQEIQAAMSTRPAGNEPNLVAWYPFDEGTGISATNGDTLASSGPATLVNTVTWVPGVRGNVVLNTNNSGAGSLRQAVIDARAGSIITFAPALSGAIIVLTNEIVLTNSISINASSLSGGITISGGNATRLFTASYPTSVALFGLTLTGGKADSGGAIAGDTDWAVSNCTFLSNNATDGLNGRGGAISCYNLILTQCTFSGNSAGAFGGAVEAFNDLTAAQCTFSGNSAGTFGGAIEVENEYLALTQCTFSGNSADQGGAIFGTLTTTITQSTFTGNSAADYGSAIALEGALNMTNCTVSGNSGSDAVYNFAQLNTLVNTIVAGNLGGDFDSQYGGVPDGVGNLLGGDPLLGPLGDHGGPTQTMLPLPGSPAIDAGSNAAAGLVTDQRGFPRVLDGDGNGSAIVDIGAVEVRRAVVTTTVDELDTPSSGGTGISLREAIRDGAADNIVFSPAVFTAGNHTINFNSEIDISSSMAIDASELPAGVVLKGGGAAGNFALFGIYEGNSVILRGLTLTNAGYSDFGESGGAIFNNGILTLLQCTLAGNSVGISDYSSGGAIYNEGTMTLQQCTLSGNSAIGYTALGGAIYNEGTMMLQQCTLSGNSGDNGYGGAIINYGTLTLTHCTLSDNFAGQGGGILNNGTLTLASSIVAGNGASSGLGSNIRGPVNLVGQNVIDQDPLLVPLGNYGGSTQTMPPLHGSPAIDAAGSTGLTTDQRGYPRVSGSAADIGAVEAQVAPANNQPMLTKAKASTVNHTFQFTFTNVPHADFSVLTATNVALPLQNWSVWSGVTEIASGQYQFIQTGVTNPAQFYRVVSP